jgi:hypothetical protein
VNTSGVEDVMHFLLDCPAYTHTRSCFADLFPAARTDDDIGAVRKLFDHPNQARFARCVAIMTEFRRQCMMAVADGSLRGALPVDRIAQHVARLQHLVHNQDDILPQLSQLPADLY